MGQEVFEKFADYLYDLLPSPWRKVPKDRNQWYILCSVIGKRFDTVKKAFETARAESMAATCSGCMLQVHADDRSLYRYQNEDDNAYRKRIAMYEATCKLGGTDRGVMLAVRTLGYGDVAIISARQYGPERWAEFYPVIRLQADDARVIDPYILRETVRKWKTVGAKDTCLVRYEVQPESIFKQPEYNKLDGTWCMDGTILMDASLHNEAIYNGEILMTKAVVTEKAREKIAEARHSTGVVPKVKYIALGTGGTMADGGVRIPLKEDVQLQNEVLRKEYSGAEQKTETSYAYTVHILPEDGITGSRISELALIDEDGDALVISCFPPKEMLDGIENEFVIYDNY